MACGIFGAAALQRIPHGAALTVPLTLALAAAWSAIAVTIAAAAVRHGIAIYTGSLVGSFAIGTWVAASTVLGRMAMLAAPRAPFLPVPAFLVGLAVWVWFAPQALGNLRRLAAAPAQASRPTGVILLTTVATQAVALLALRLFGGLPAIQMTALVLIGIGAVCYLAGAALVLRRYVFGPPWRLAVDWDATNCILHGALSITGLTASVSGRLGVATLAPFWALTLTVFVLVEGIEVGRLASRLRAFGWHDAILVYDTSQWARNFTFGMFYAFTAAFAGGFDVAAAYPALGRLTAAILAYGQYLVLLLLVAELALLALWLAGRVRTAASSLRED